MHTTTTGTFESESERVTRQLRDEIVSRLRRPGSKIIERDLAAELGVSRVPVRDALRMLVTEGLVTPRPRTWAVMRTLTPSDVEDFHEIRSALASDHVDASLDTALDHLAASSGSEVVEGREQGD